MYVLARVLPPYKEMSEDLQSLLILADDENIIESPISLLGILALEKIHTENQAQIRNGQPPPHQIFTTLWQRLYNSRNDRDYIMMLGFDVDTFHYILDHGFEAEWNENCVPRPPQFSRHLLDAAGALGLGLHFLHSTTNVANFAEMFGLARWPTTIIPYIDISIHILLSVLRTLPDGKIKWPSPNDFQSLNSLIVPQHPLLTGAFGTIGGLDIPLEGPADEEIDDATYNCSLRGHFVRSAFVYDASGVIIGGSYNAPGCWHYAQIARSIYEKLRVKTPNGYYLVAETAFPRGTSDIRGRIQATSKVVPQDPVAQAFENQLLSFLQHARYGNRVFQQSFGRLCVPLPKAEQNRRANILDACVRLHNLRVRRIGLDRIHTVYRPIWVNADQSRWHNFATSI